MKKTLFLVTATTLALTAGAQTKSEMAKNVAAMPVVTSEVVGAETLHLLTASEAKAQHKVAPMAGVDAWYNRPVGTMWQTYITTDGKAFFQACMAPYLHVNPWRDVTFVSEATDAASQEWKVYYRKQATTYTTPSVTAQWGCRTDTIPVLTTRDGRGNASVYTPQAYNAAGSTKYASFINSYSGYVNQYRPGSAQHFWSSPKFFGGETNRDGTRSAGAYTASVTDNYGQPAGKLMGKNSLNLNGMAIAAEAPEHPYVINRVGLRYQCLQLADGVSVPMTATIYKLESIPAYTSDGTPVIMGEPTEVLATVTVNVNNSWLASQREQYKLSDGYYGILPFALPEPLEVNSAILVCVEGYNVADMSANFSSVYSSDFYDEGHGEIGYIKAVSGGKPVFVGIRGSYLSPSCHTAPAVLLDEERRFLEYNKADETGSWDAPVEGGDSIVDIFSYLPAANISIKATEVDKNGAVLMDGQAPQWLTLSLKDQVDPWGNPVGSGIVHLDAKLSANPGADRAAQVELSFPGAKLVYTIQQSGNGIKGDINGDGVVDIADVNILIDMILNQPDDPKQADLNGDGTIDIADANIAIDIVLGK